MNNKNKAYITFFIGLILSLVLPYLLGAMIYFEKMETNSWKIYREVIASMLPLASPLIRLGLLINLGLFLLFIRKNIFAARGIVIGTLFWAIYLLIIFIEVNY